SFWRTSIVPPPPSGLVRSLKHWQTFMSATTGIPRGGFTPLLAVRQLDTRRQEPRSRDFSTHAGQKKLSGRGGRPKRSIWLLRPGEAQTSVLGTKSWS